MPSRPLLDTWHRIIDYLLAQRRSLFELVYQYPRVLGHTPKSDRDVDHNAGSSSSHPHHAGKRKALLVGISYESREDEVFRQLDGPHTDIEMMRAYLKEHDFDVVVMTDTPGAGDLAPTRANMIREMKNLVAGAGRRDSFVFHYAGHSDQVVALWDRNEDDGMDEVLVPVDHNGLEDREKLIIDDELRKLLVEPLPIGAKLTAIFDSCHSGTLLDLDHDKCNDLDPKDKLFRVVRTATLVSVFRRRIYTTTRINTHHVQIRRLSVELKPEKNGSPSKQLILESRISTFHSEPNLVPSMSPMDPIAHRLVTRSQRPSTRTVQLGISKLNTQKVPRRKCTGMCPISPTPRQNAVSISACRDGQFTFEDENGCSLSQALVAVLRQNPELTHAELLAQLRCRVNETAIRMHDWYHENGRNCSGVLITSPSGTVAPRKCSAVQRLFYTWQPQLASQKRLNMQDRFSLIC
ncbi:unnamed protein product [Somion occarium]|uniref:Peptidase C14 caspase domain-containing protein n=1 Tax=Somion occarium TaxID=3059160 RepID=A0ABP1CTA1_9APHY